MFLKSKGKRPDDDSGETIANMNVEGMPWYRPPRGENEETPPPRLSRRELLSLILNAMLAGLAVALVFVAAGALVILFCTNIWL